MESKIIQLMPVPVGVYGLVWDDNGNRRQVPLLAVGLTELGETVFLYVDGQSVARTKEATDRRYR